MNNTYQDYLDGKCTALEYMRNEYITTNGSKRWQQGEVEEIIKKDHSYFVFTVPNDFTNKRVDGVDYTIRDMENGVRVIIDDVFYPYEAKDFFDYCYDTDEEFKEYVDTNGKCLEIER